VVSPSGEQGADGFGFGGVHNVACAEPLRSLESIRLNVDAAAAQITLFIWCPPIRIFYRKNTATPAELREAAVKLRSCRFDVRLALTVRSCKLLLASHESILLEPFTPSSCLSSQQCLQ
jgi:hypothetical protein